VHKFTHRTIHLLNLFLAVSFYLFANIAITAEMIYWQDKSNNIFSFPVLMGLMLFFYASYHQHKCHKILASLRTKEDTFSIPRGDWFEYVSCPHYFAEILIYISIVFVVGPTNLSAWLIICFVILNLSHSALLTHSWYQKQFHKSYPNQRKVIFPFVL